MNMKTIFHGLRGGIILVVVIAGAISAATRLSAEDARAREIVRSLDEADSTEGSRTTLRMTVYPDSSGMGNERIFKLLMLTRGDDEAFTEIIEPKSVKGLRILSVGDDTWLFFPSTGRVRKIAGSSRGDSVQGVGGDFSYEDIGSGTWNETYDFSLALETPEKFELDGIPRKNDAIYSRVRIVVDRSIMRPLRIEFSTVKDGRLKDLEFSEYRDFGGRLTAGKMEMKNLKKGSRTVVETLEAEYSKIPDGRYFNPGRFNQ